MAYMPNYGYPQYGYQNQFNPNQFGQNQFTQQIPQSTLNQAPAVPQQQFPTIFGKIVDCYDTAKSQDVPLGLTGVYPKADGTSVFIKQWCQDGTTATKEYKLVEQIANDEALPTIDWSESFNKISDRIELLSKKLDDIKLSSTPPKKKKVEVEVDEDDE